MNNFKIGDIVIDINEECAPREVVPYYCKHMDKTIKGLKGTTDGVTIVLTDYNKKMYKKISEATE